MLRISAFLVLALFILVTPVLAVERPQTPGFNKVNPTPPPKPETPEVPAPPDVSGLYEVPERPGLKVRVFAHPPRPEAPKAPGKTPKPSPTVAENNALVCNLQDPDSASVTGKTGWKIPSGNWNYLLNLKSVPSTVGSTNLDAIVKSGFNQYTSATSGKVNFIRGADTTVSRARLDGRNIISWGNASNGTLGVTYVWYYPSTGQAVEIDTIMNNKYKWTWSNSLTCADNTKYDAQDIMTHELGHWLGLTDEYNAPLFGNNTMYGYGSLGEVKKNTLTTGDILGIQSIYLP